MSCETGRPRVSVSLRQFSCREDLLGLSLPASGMEPSEEAAWTQPGGQQAAHRRPEPMPRGPPTRESGEVRIKRCRLFSQRNPGASCGLGPVPTCNGVTLFSQGAVEGDLESCAFQGLPNRGRPPFPGQTLFFQLKRDVDFWEPTVWSEGFMRPSFSSVNYRARNGWVFVRSGDMVFEDERLCSTPGPAWLVTGERKGLGEHGKVVGRRELRECTRWLWVPSSGTVCEAQPPGGRVRGGSRGPAPLSVHGGPDLVPHLCPEKAKPSALP